MKKKGFGNVRKESECSEYIDAQSRTKMGQFCPIRKIKIKKERRELRADNSGDQKKKYE